MAPVLRALCSQVFLYKSWQLPRGNAKLLMFVSLCRSVRLVICTLTGRRRKETALGYAAGDWPLGGICGTDHSFGPGSSASFQFTPLSVHLAYTSSVFLWGCHGRPCPKHFYIQDKQHPLLSSSTLPVTWLQKAVRLTRHYPCWLVLNTFLSFMVLWMVSRLFTPPPPQGSR